MRRETRAVGADAPSEGRDARDLLHALELDGLEYAGGDRTVDLVVRLGDAAEDDRVRRDATRERNGELTRAHDVRAAPRASASARTTGPAVFAFTA